MLAQSPKAEASLRIIAALLFSIFLMGFIFLNDSNTATPEAAPTQKIAVTK